MTFHTDKDRQLQIKIYGLILIKIKSLLIKNSDYLFIGVFVLALTMFILPMPTPIIDTFIAGSISFSFIVLVTTLYIRTVLDISSFPVIILLGAVFRLALTVSTARLVLAQGDAGEIITAFGDFVIAGNIVVGLVVFLIVAFVQFIVITKGAERIAEVSARFTLDAIPGKQLAIDGDLRNGLIDPAAAQQRREALEQESQFFGAMDGAMRFVKGDAIAALVVVLVNLVGGFCIGVFQRGMSFGEAAHLYALLSVGDGLVAQIPSMLTAIAAGIVVSRVATTSASSLGAQLFRQVSAEPRGLVVVSMMTGGAGFIPGFPSLVLWGLSISLGLAAWRRLSRSSALEAAVHSASDAELGNQPLDRTKYGDPFVATVNQDMFDRLEDGGLAIQLEGRIRDVARMVGLAVTVPTFQIDNRMVPNAIHLQVENVPVAMLECAIERSIGDIAVDLARVTRRQVSPLFGLPDATQWLTSLEGRLGHLATQVKNQIPIYDFSAITRTLLASGVTLSQPRAYLEVLLHEHKADINLEALAEKGRKALSKQIAYGLIDFRGLLPVIVLEPDWEPVLRRLGGNSSAAQKAEREAHLRSLVDLVDKEIKRANRENIDPIVLMSPDLRHATQALFLHLGYYMPVVALDEVPPEMTVEVISRIALPSLHPA